MWKCWGYITCKEWGVDMIWSTEWIEFAWPPVPLGFYGSWECISIRVGFSQAYRGGAVGILREPCENHAKTMQVPFSWSAFSRFYEATLRSNSTYWCVAMNPLPWCLYVQHWRLLWIPYHKLARNLGSVSILWESIFLKTGHQFDDIPTLIGELVQEYLKRDAYLSDQVRGDHPNHGDIIPFCWESSSFQEKWYGCMLWYTPGKTPIRRGPTWGFSDSISKHG